MVFCRFWTVVTLWDPKLKWKMSFFNLSIYDMVLRNILACPVRNKMNKRVKQSKIWLFLFFTHHGDRGANGCDIRATHFLTMVYLNQS